MDKVETLRLEPKPDPKGELKSISLINMTHPSLEEALDKINPKVTNPSEILDIHEESTLELEKEDDINEHGSYFINTPLLMVTNTHFDHQHFTQKHGKVR